MATAALVLTGLVALLHVWFLVLEMFLWTEPIGLRTFRNTHEKAEVQRVLAANQGLYNGFLAAGLLWGLLAPDPALGLAVRCYFLACVLVAGVYGAATVSRRIFLVQGLPALLALVLTRLAGV